MANIYDVNGNIIDVSGGSASALDYRTICHQGYYPGSITPNTKSAFISAKNNGFTIIETDLNKTSDNVLVMSHDSVADQTLVQWQTSSERMTFIEFLQLAKKLNIEVYLDGKSGMGSYLQTVYDSVVEYGLLKNFTFTGSLSSMYTIDANCRCAHLVGNLGMDLSSYHQGNILYCNYANVTYEEAQNAVDNGFPLEFYTFTSENSFLTCLANLPQGQRWCTDNIGVDVVMMSNL